MAAWAGLGYYSRARNLVKAAREVSQAGAFPPPRAELRKLPGLGDYTAAAVAAIAFRAARLGDRRQCRAGWWRGYSPSRSHCPARRRLSAPRSIRLRPSGARGTLHKPWMDLGSSLCRARDAQCLLCPWQEICEAREAGDPTRLPVKAAKKAKPTRSGTAFWIERDGSVWLVSDRGRGCSAECARCPMMAGRRAATARAWRRWRAPGVQADWCGIASPTSTLRWVLLFMRVTNRPRRETANGGRLIGWTRRACPRCSRRPPRLLSPSAR